MLIELESSDVDWLSNEICELVQICTVPANRASVEICTACKQ
jgi:hypothetical protein